VLAINGDNAKSNNTQTTALANMENSFEEVHRVRCFNHTLQLSSKALLKPFNIGISKESDDEPVDDEDDDMPLLEDVDDDEEDENDVDGENECEDGTVVEDDDVDELETLTEEERAQILAETAAVHTMVTKVCFVLSLLREALLVTEYIFRFIAFPSRSFVPPQSRFQHGARHVPSVASSQDLFLAML
jgi:hypothetical protein